MLRVAGKPILHNIIDLLKKHGFKRFYISVYYKSEMIKAYFGNGEKFGIEITYIEEEKPLGTAGSLSLTNKERVLNCYELRCSNECEFLRITKFSQF